MTQLPIDIAALLLSNSPNPGMTLPASGATLIGTPGQSLPFADALHVLMGETGQQPISQSTEELIARLSQGAIPTEEAVRWFGEGSTGSDEEPSAMVLTDDSAQQDTDDLSQFHFLATANAETTAAPILTSASSDEPDTILGPFRGSPIEVEVTALEPMAEEAPQGAQAKASRAQETESPANVKLPVRNHTAQAHTLDIVHSETKLTTGAANREPAAPRITVMASAQQPEELTAPPATNSREEAFPSPSRVIALDAAGGQTKVGAQPEPESFLRAVGQFDNDATLKVEITPSYNSKPGAAASHRMDQLTGSNESRPTIQPVFESGAAQGTTPVVKATPRLTQTAETQTVISNESAKVIPLVSAPVETFDPKTAKTRTPVRPTEESESTPSSDGRRIGKTDLPHDGRINAISITTKPAAAPPPTPRRDAQSLADTNPVKSLDPVKADQPQTQVTQAASSASHSQAAEQTERTDSPPPARFQVEIPKPLRVPGQIRVHLDPPELGHVRINLSSRPDGIVGSLRFQSEQARHIVEREIGQLQKTLQNAGVRVERLEVLPASPSDSRNSLHTHMNNQQSWSQHTASQNAFGGTARGHVGVPNQNTRQNESAETPVRSDAYPTAHIGRVNLVA